MIEKNTSQLFFLIKLNDLLVKHFFISVQNFEFQKGSIHIVNFVDLMLNLTGLGLHGFNILKSANINKLINFTSL